MKNNYLLIIFFFYSLNMFSQIPVGYNHAPNGELIFGTYHPFLNKEFDAAEVSLDNIYGKEKGYLKLLNSKQAEKTYIDFHSNKIRTETDTTNTLYVASIKNKYKIEEIEYFKLGVDSFFVVNKINTKDNIILEPSVIKYVFCIDSLEYGQYYKYTSNGYLKDKFFVNKKNNEWHRIYLEDEPVKHKIFTSYAKFIDKKELTEEKFLNVLKQSDYALKMKNKETTYFDRSWQELKKQDKSNYSAKITNIKDTIFSLEYYNRENNKLFQVNFSSLNPIKKHEKMSVYDYEKLKSERSYKNDSLKHISYFYDSGSLMMKTTIKKVLFPSGKKYFETDVLNLQKEDGNNILKEDGLYTFKHGENLEVKYQVENKKLVNSFVEKNGSKYYFFKPKKGKNIIGYKFKSAFESFLYENVKFKKARFKENLEGTLLIDFITDSKGRVVEYKIKNTLNNSLDSLIKEFCELKFSEKAEFKFKFSGIKLEDKKAYCKFLLPVTFTHTRKHRTFSRPDNSFMMHHMMFQQQMMWQQQQMMRAPGF